MRICAPIVENNLESKQGKKTRKMFSSVVVLPAYRLVKSVVNGSIESTDSVGVSRQNS